MNHITGVAREQINLFPEAIEDYLSAENPVRFLDAFVESLEMKALGFRHATVEETGRPPYHPKDLLKLYLYGYLNRIRSSRLLERETKRNLEVLWPLKRLSPDHKTISDFRRENTIALRETFKQFVLTCKELELFSTELVAIDSTKFKASNARGLVKDRHGIELAYRMRAAVDAKHSLIVDYELTNEAADNNHLSAVATAAQQMLGVETFTVCADAGYYVTVDLKVCDDQKIITYVPIPEPKISKKTQVPTPPYYNDEFVYDQTSDTYTCPQSHQLTYYRTTHKQDHRRIRIYRTSACRDCPVRVQCTTSPRGRYIDRWEDEAILERLKRRLASAPELIRRRKAIIEHVFGTIKKIWGYGALLLRRLQNIASEVAMMNLAYNIKRVLTIVGTRELILKLQQA